MGQTSSSEETDELKRFSIKLEENRTLPLNLCFIVQTNGEKRDFISKLGEIVCILDKKHICSRNIYALLLNDYELKMVTFCNREKFLNEIKPIIASANNKRGLTYASNTNDIYQKAFDYLVWKSSNRIVVKLNLVRTNKPSDYELRMRANHNVDFFEIKSLDSLDLLIEKFQNIDSKKIENKLTPKVYNFTSSTSEVCKYKGKRISLKPGSNIINQKFLSTLETSSQLKQLQSHFLKEDCEFEIEKNPFSKGKEVYCFKGSYRDPRNPGKNNPKVFKLSQYVELNIEENFIAQLIASFLAREYTKTLGNQYIIGYSEPSLVVVKVDGKERIYLMEDFCEGNFVKFTSNAVMMPVTDYTQSEKFVIDFSHWSHEFTEKKLMVVDLQGWQIDENLFCLTDPAIHSEAGKVFGKTDMGRLGFNRYYAFHKNICVLKDWFPINDQKLELNEQKRESPNEPNSKETEKVDVIPLKQRNTTNDNSKTITNNTIIKSSQTTILDPKSTKNLKSSPPLDRPKVNSPKFLTTINNNHEEVKIEKFPATARESWNSNDYSDAILPLAPNINNGSKSGKNSPKDNNPFKQTANNKTIPIENFPNQLIPSELLKITKTFYEELLDLDKALAKESLKDNELIDVIKQIGKILLKLSSKERQQNSWKAHSENLINILLDTYKRIYDKHKNKPLNFANYNQYFVNHALDVMCKSAVQLYFLLGHSNPQIKYDLVKTINYYHMKLNFNNFMHEFLNESVPKYEQFLRIAGDDKYLGDFKKELKQLSDNYKKLQIEISKKEAKNRMTTATITTKANSNGDHSTREPYRRWHKFQVKHANSNEQYREEKAIKLVISAINDVVKELNLQTIMNQIDFSNWVMKLDDISKKIESCQPTEKIFWIERALKKILKVHSITYDMYKKSIENNDLENTYNISSMLILLCEMAIEIYEIFQNRLNHEFAKAIIQIINDVQVNLSVRTSDHWEIWMAYFINFIERHQPS